MTCLFQNNFGFASTFKTDLGPHFPSCCTSKCPYYGYSGPKTAVVLSMISLLSTLPCIAPPSGPITNVPPAEPVHGDQAGVAGPHHSGRGHGPHPGGGQAEVPGPLARNCHRPRTGASRLHYLCSCPLICLLPPEMLPDRGLLLLGNIQLRRLELPQLHD